METTPYSFESFNPDNGVYTVTQELALPRSPEILARFNTTDLLSVPDPTVLDIIDGTQFRLLEVVPSGEYDESRVIVRVMDFANGIAPHSYAAALAVANLLGHKVIVLPQNEIQLHSKIEKNKVKSGNLGPLDMIYSEAIEQVIDVEQLVTLYGYSFGAQAVAGLSSYINRNGVVNNDMLVIAEPPNTVNRTKAALLKSFMQAGMPELIGASLDSEWPAYTDLLEIKGSKSKYFDKDSRKFALDAISKVNRAIISAMQKEDFDTDLRMSMINAPSNFRVILAREASSTITPQL